MPAYRITAPRDMGKICQGFEFTINSPSSDPSHEIKDYLNRMGYEKEAQQYWSSGNWKVEKLG
jgi:hypothetical protein